MNDKHICSGEEMPAHVVQTNREWINSLDNKHFAMFMRTFAQDACSCCAGHNGQEEDCGDCFDGQIKWLDTEHDESGWEERYGHYCV